MGTHLALTSPAFEPNGVIPAKYTCDGDPSLSPPLTISGIPEEAKALILMMSDPDIPEVKKQEFGIEMFDHWILYNIPVTGSTLTLEEGQTPEGALVAPNTRGKKAYTGPCPPSEYEPREHRYIFTVYTLSEMIEAHDLVTKKEILEKLGPLVIEQAELIGRYARA